MDNNFNEAIGYFQKVVEIKPDDFRAHCSLGNAWYVAGDVDKAIEECLISIGIKPSAWAHFILGSSCYAKGDVDKGILEYKKAIELKGDFVEAMSVLGVCYSERGQLLEALDEFLKARTIDKNYAEAYFNAGNTYVKLGKYPEALSEYREAVRIDPENLDFVYECAILEEEYGDLDAALGLWEKFMGFPEASVYWDKMKEAENRLASVKRKLKRKK